MSSFEKFQTSSKVGALTILKDGVAKIEAFQSKHEAQFPFGSLSGASSDFASMVVAANNPKVDASVATALDVLDCVGKDIQVVETFLHLHIPKMEDGNNFGVTVQLSLLKQISDLQEVVTKHIESLSSYASSRADALDKLGLPSVSASTTTSSSSSTTDGKKEEKESEAKEEKKTLCDISSPAYAARVSSLVAVDALYYSKAQRASLSTISLYAAILDFFEKNEEKLKQPKGSAGSRSAYSGMY